MQSIRKVNILFSLIFILGYSIFSQSIRKLDFYGVISSDADKNMIKMTEDLFYTQLKDFNISINDFRESTKSNNIQSENKLTFSNSTPDATVFYVVIERKGDALSKWNCKICIKKVSDISPITFIKEYDSYYKILMESKDSLKTALNSLLIKQKTNQALQEKLDEPLVSDNNVKDKTIDNSNIEDTIKIDSLTGTWTGENFIAKIVIMKGGRGFIIFKDGAAMNILVTVNKNEQDDSNLINVKQTGHSNASYFPELTRKDAIEAAKIAKHIEWNFNFATEEILSGKKKTLQIDKETNSFIEEYIDVSWTKKND